MNTFFMPHTFVHFLLFRAFCGSVANILPLNSNIYLNIINSVLLLKIFFEQIKLTKFHILCVFYLEERCAFDSLHK